MNDKKPFWKEEKNLWIIFIVLFLIIAAIVLRPLWKTFRTKVPESAIPSSTPSPSVTTSSAVPEGLLPEDLTVASETFKLLQRVRAVSLDFSIFSDPRFTKLESFEVPIVVPPLGRDNPFKKF